VFFFALGIVYVDDKLCGTGIDENFVLVDGIVGKSGYRDD
jgi:hypothetical protein